MRLPIEFLEYPLGYYLENAPDTRTRMQQKLRDYALLKAPGGGIEAMIVDDSPARAIVQTASSMNAALIIMGTHGLESRTGAVMGSVAQSTLEHAGVPVLMVK